MSKFLPAVLASFLLSSPALADEFVLVPAGMSFDDATFAVESSIVGRGLQVEYTSHVGEMLERTRADVGSDVTLFTNANIYLFCSASMSRQAMEANWQNIAFCPYGVHVIERPGEAVMIGYMRRDAPGMEPVNAFLADLVAEVTE
ncbi:MAG: DUF302 domain-containing protein [Rhodobacter sp.]|uniref:DUF302 domain-containing protein n=1 Tax=Pararhodobacter sp. TaxID=2127056 RepID=UPI001DBE47B7|nr:DUF302 domain-containing protein [Pararhodobacter sp.]MCB1344085.1 DUF302 domain-containing protein [Paracoccaceae bacterium]MCC0071647.1 DUF302 domain-containing protein [Rhodobacter sp.]HPD93468.1 DUF302 domain-containing protein [Pararhodobacter sp.]